MQSYLVLGGIDELLTVLFHRSIFYQSLGNTAQVNHELLRLVQCVHDLKLCHEFIYLTLWHFECLQKLNDEV